MPDLNGSQYQYSFEVVKKQLKATPLLAYCSRRDGLISEAIEEIQIYFLSSKLSPAQQRWPIIDKGVYAIVFVLQKLNHYLDRAEFEVKKKSQTIPVSV